MRYLRLLFLVIITVSISSALFLGGCGGDGDDDLASWEKVIGPEGGTIEVAEPSSRIYGVKIEIPAGALAQEATIIISEYEEVSALPAGMKSIYPIVNLSSNTPFLKDINITFPIWNIPSRDGEILSAFYLQTDGATWTTVIPIQIKDNQMIIKTDHLSAWRWGVVSLEEAEPETIKAAIEEMFYVDDWNEDDLNELTTGVGKKIESFTSTFDEWLDYFYYWDECDDRQEVAKILNYIIQVTEAGITEYLETQSVIDACDPVYICELSNMLITDEQGRLMKWIEGEIRALFGEGFWSLMPGNDILMDVVGKALIEAQYRHAVEYELGCDYRCILENGNLNFFINVLACNISYLALFGMEVYESYDPCTP